MSQDPYVYDQSEALHAPAKSPTSGQSAQCVTVQSFPGHTVRLGDDKHPGLASLAFSPGEWNRFREWMRNSPDDDPIVGYRPEP
ncbi:MULTISPECIES: DUF397 domain-containing protein [unclassified Kitasatospora]|uniref:DUF397 domain-containing protein n=1 Tax=unclassified Kitasatospora TaxID=2633591 RepID=UPI002474B0FC|nr:DUF397 domain-containing protein [Kitasatospora sp. MAP12-44]